MQKTRKKLANYKILLQKKLSETPSKFKCKIKTTPKLSTPTAVAVSKQKSEVNNID
jgi:hypothetical protein